MYDGCGYVRDGAGVMFIDGSGMSVCVMTVGM